MDENRNDLINTDGPEVPKTALTFEISEEDGVLIIKDEESEVVIPETKVEDTSTSEPVGEFTIPENFEISDRYTSENYVEDRYSIRATYVPRFTEVSENYRMKGDPRPLPKTESEDTTPLGRESDAIRLDPTAEIEREGDVSKVVVTTTPQRIGEPIDESVTVFKFAGSQETEETSQIPAAPRILVDSSDTTSTTPELVIEPVNIFATTEQQTTPEPTVSNADEPVSTHRDDTDSTPSDQPYVMPDPALDEEILTPEREDEPVILPKGADDMTDRRGEFNNYGQRDEIKDKFLDSLLSVKVRLFSCILVLVGLIAVEALGFFGIKATAFFGIDRLPYAPLLLDFPFVLCLLLLSLPEIGRVIRSLWKKTVLPEINIVISLLFVVGYSVVIYLSGISNYMTLGLLFAIQVFMAILASYYRIKAEFVSFRVASRNTAKNVIDLKMTRELPRENIALDGAVDEYKSITARLFPTAFVSGFFKNNDRNSENSINTIINISISLGIAIVTAVVSFFLGDGLSGGAQAFAVVYMLAVPTFSTLIHKIPLKHALSLSESEDATFIGERALYDASGIDVLTYLDTDIFGEEDVTIRNVHLYGNAGNMPKAMKHMYALFSAVGGPLDFVFSQALERGGAQAKNIVIEEDGISGVLDGRRVYAGTLEYMQRKGVAIPDEDLTNSASLHTSTRLLYGAEDSQIFVRFSIRYSFSEEFAMILPYLKENKIVPLIYTRDPNITSDLVKFLTSGDDIIRIMKKNVPPQKEEHLYRRIDSGIVTYSDKEAAFNMLVIARKYTGFQVSLAITELISMIVGAALGVLIALGEMFIIPVSTLASWQLVWCLVLYIRSKIRFGIEKKEKGNQ